MDGWMDVTLQFPLAASCSGMVRATMTKVSRIIGTVHPFTVLKFRARAISEVPSARTQLRHWFNIGRLLLPEMHVQRLQWAQKPGLQN